MMNLYDHVFIDLLWPISTAAAEGNSIQIGSTCLTAAAAIHSIPDPTRSLHCPAIERCSARSHARGRRIAPINSPNPNRILT